MKLNCITKKSSNKSKVLVSRLRNKTLPLHQVSAPFLFSTQFTCSVIQSNRYESKNFHQPQGPSQKRWLSSENKHYFCFISSLLTAEQLCPYQPGLCYQVFHSYRSRGNVSHEREALCWSKTSPVHTPKPISSGPNLHACLRQLHIKPNLNLPHHCLLPRQNVHICLTSAATSPLALRWMYDSPRTGCAWRTTHIYMWREQAIIEWS